MKTKNLYSILPLEWKGEIIDGSGLINASCGFDIYDIFQSEEDEDMEYKYYVVNSEGDVIETGDTIEEVKEKVEKYYQEILLKCLKLEVESSEIICPECKSEKVEENTEVWYECRDCNNVFC